MRSYYYRQLVRSRSRLSSKRKAFKEAQFSPSKRRGSQDIEPLLLNKKGAAKDIQDMPLMYHIDCIVRGLQKRFKDMPLLVRTILVLSMLYALSNVVNTLIQLLTLSMNWMYTILGIIASIIVTYEFFIKQQRKKPR